MTTQAAPATKGADFRDYPFLTEDEFAEVCHSLDRLYRHATLGPLRRRWRLSVCTALNTVSFSSASEYSTYIQITRPLELGADGDDAADDIDLLSQMDKISLAPVGRTTSADSGLGDVEDEAMVEAENADSAALPRPAHATTDIGYATYEIHLHPTYRAPCLWFSLHALPDYEPAFSIDTVFRRLVPDQFKDSLRSMGSIGGISVDYHPVTGVPSFFVHPCLIGEAMSEFDCSKENYLVIWLGLVGGCVSLWVPREMAVLCN